MKKLQFSSGKFLALLALTTLVLLLSVSISAVGAAEITPSTMQQSAYALLPAQDVTVPTVTFDQGDTAVCWCNARDITIKATIQLPPSIPQAKIVFEYRVVTPNATAPIYKVVQPVTNGQVVTLNSAFFGVANLWPGSGMDNTFTEIHIGATLLDINTSNPLSPQNSGSLDYYTCPDPPKVMFDPAANTYMCSIEPTNNNPKVTVHLPASYGPAKLVLEYRIVNPPDRRTNPVYKVINPVTDGYTVVLTPQLFGLSSPEWPGIRPGDTIVENHFGANLLDPNTGAPLTGCGKGLDYFWVPSPSCPGPMP